MASRHMCARSLSSVALLLLIDSLVTGAWETRKWQVSFLAAQISVPLGSPFIAATPKIEFFCTESRPRL